MSSWAARRVRRLLTSSPSVASLSVAVGTETQTDHADHLEHTECRRCRRRFKQRRLFRLRESPADSQVKSFDEQMGDKASTSSRLAVAFFSVIREVLQYPWGADALFMVALVLLASLLVILYYIVAVVLPILVLAVMLAILNSVLLESSYCGRLLRHLKLA
uniref:Uncharacterized protein n=1 Tax=Ixodes ricinus TaxID=34613 RepID=A0A147BSA5_IXORI